MALRQQQCDLALQAARAAGREILSIRTRGFGVAEKTEDRGPVTTADLRANEILRNALLGAFPEDGWLSEETREDPARLDRPRVWIVDPIDGTKEFVRDIPEYCVSVALVEDGAPVVGVVHVPAAAETYHAVAGEGAFCNAKPIGFAPLQRAQRNGEPLLAVSRSETEAGKWAWAESLAQFRPTGSVAYKLCLVAAGRVDGTMTLAPRNEWDIAAGVLILAEAGGACTDRGRSPFRFNRPDPLRSGLVAAAAPGDARIDRVFEQSLHHFPVNGHFAC